MNLKEKLNEDMRKALRKKDVLRLSTIRLLLAAIKNLEIAKGKDKELKEFDLIGALSSEAKKRKEAIAEYKKGKREDLVGKETKELEILKEYLPEELSPEELERVIMETIEEVGARALKDMGKVMGAVMGKVQGRADGKAINQIVKKRLAQHEDK